MENFANNFSTTLYASVNATDTTIVVSDSTGSPAPNFRILIDSEYLLVTGKNGNTWTVNRGIESSTPAVHAAGTSLAQILTVAGLKTLIAQQSTVYNYEWAPLPVSGAVTLALPDVPTKVIKLYVNGLGQPTSEINFIGNQVTINASLNTAVGDVISVEYAI